MPPAFDKSAKNKTAHHTAPDKTFTLSMDHAKVPLILTRKAQREFELQGLETMDECLMTLTERLTPANEPNLRPHPLDLMGQMMLDSAYSGNIRKLMLCTLWLGHHYPSLSGLIVHGAIHNFVTHDEAHTP